MILIVFVLLFCTISQAAFVNAPFPVLTPCPGHYCGRTELQGGNWSACGPCPRGSRANATSACVQCTDSLTFYDWLYLGFMVLLSLVLHWICIDKASKHRGFTKGVIVLHISAFVESVAASILTLILFDPIGQLHIHACRVKRLADWYTMLHNPTPDYAVTLHCTQEAVYPLYTMVCVFYTLSLVMLLLIRPILARQCLPVRGKTSIYAALYFLPILVVIQAVGGGLLYYSFPYIIVVLSVISSAAHYAFQLDQSMSALIKGSIRNMRNLVILLGHWTLHAYGIISITELKQPLFHGLLILLVPLPSLFYILTSRFTNPSRLHLE